MWCIYYLLLLLVNDFPWFMTVFLSFHFDIFQFWLIRNPHPFRFYHIFGLCVWKSSFTKIQRSWFHPCLFRATKIMIFEQNCCDFQTHRPRNVYYSGNHNNQWEGWRVTDSGNKAKIRSLWRHIPPWSGQDIDFQPKPLWFSESAPKK